MDVQNLWTDGPTDDGVVQIGDWDTGYGIWDI
jgi:hypothetical protein